jgi:mono/diheme cytochrome c family protein
VLYVGFLLVVGLVVSGCQPVQPVSATPASPDNDVVEESEPVTDTVVVTEVVTEDTTADTTVGDAVTDTVTVSESATIRIDVSSPSDSTAVADPAMLAAGLAVYRAQYCGVCHTLDAAETRGTFGPVHNGMGAMANERLQDENYHGAATTATDYIRESIVDPQVFIVPGYAATSHRMPVYAHLDLASLDALVAFLSAQ